jgi:hypothetical protein
MACCERVNESKLSKRPTKNGFSFWSITLISEMRENETNLKVTKLKVYPTYLILGIFFFV